MVQIAPIYLSTTIITTLKDNKKTGTASGFFYEDRSNNLFLITNKHVIYGKGYDKNLIVRTDKFKLNLHTDQNDFSHNELVEIPLFDGDNRLWLEHQHAYIDVIVLPIKGINRNKYIIKPINDIFFDIKDIIIDFQKIFVMGYPHGWYDKFNNIPITTIGHLSGPFELGFGGEPFMLGNETSGFTNIDNEQLFMFGDVETYPGMSGAPVFMSLDYYATRGGSLYLNGTKTILIGIHSGKPIIYDKNEKPVPHSLIKIWSYRLIQEILSYTRQNKTNVRTAYNTN